MRRRTTPLDWPRYDPRHYRFAMPNAVWEYRLKPVEFLIFSYLCYYDSTGVPALESIATGVHMTAATVKKYLGSLIGKRLVNKDGASALRCMDEKFFTLPNEIFLLRLPPSAFLAYAYLLLVEDRRTHTCHPSYNAIAVATRISKNTALKSIGTLLETGLITVEPSSYFDKHGMKWKGNNLYTILPVRPAADAFHQRQLQRLELEVKRRRVFQRQKEYDRRHPRDALCAPVPAPATPDPSQQCKPLYGP